MRQFIRIIKQALSGHEKLSGRRRRRLTQSYQPEEVLEQRLLLSADISLLKDINTNGANASSDPGWATQVGDFTFFVAESPDSGKELWKTDGTEAGTVLVKDINPGEFGSFASHLEELNGQLYFRASDGINGTELWRSDGTEAGTVMVSDINPGSASSVPEWLTNVNGTLFFEANNGTNGKSLWKSDGSDTGTVEVKDLRSGTEDPEIAYLIGAGSTLYFTADDGSTGTELWKSDGTDAGTVLVRDIRPGLASSFPFRLTERYGSLYFTANDGTSGSELWKTDGTESGTEMVADIRAGSSGASISYLTNVSGQLYFRAFDGVSGFELWKSNGTEAGTELVRDIDPGTGNSSPQKLLNVNGTLYFTADDDINGRELWKSDGTAAGTELVRDIRSGEDGSTPINLISLRGHVFFTAQDEFSGRELWRSDGTAAGTVMVKDIRPGGPSSSILWGHVLNDRLFLSISDGVHGSELWISDGSAGGTRLLRDINTEGPSSQPLSFTEMKGNLYFTASTPETGRELWKTDGSTEGTQLVRDIWPGTTAGGFAGSSSPTSLTNVDGILFFAARTEDAGNALWKSDGTEAGTVMVKDIHSYTTGSATIRDLINVNGVLYFVARDLEHGEELWKSDGTEAGTVLVRDIDPGSASSSPRYLTSIGDQLFFSARSSDSGTELWTSDGSESGTFLVRDISPGSGSSSPRDLVNMDGILYFRAEEPTTGSELWRSEGKASDTLLVKDIRPGPDGSFPGGLVNVGGKLLFSANDGSRGSELWVSDGKESGTSLLADINQGPLGSSIGQKLQIDGTTYFRANDGSKGAELWKTDGTSSGTVQVADINRGEFGSDIQWLTNVNGRLYFKARGGTSNWQLWSSDGAAATTVPVTDASGSITSYNVDRVFEFGKRAWLTATTTAHGLELFEVLDSADYGDAPFSTAHADNGARHQPHGIRLGAQRDTEADGIATSDALGDDADGNKDEDGVTFSSFVRGSVAEMTLNIQNAGSHGYADAWIDFNQDGDWDDPGEQILASEPVSNGLKTFTVHIPANAAPGETFVRTRVSEQGGLLPTGLSLTGEVEDHAVTILQDLSVSAATGNGTDSLTVRRVGGNLEFKNITTDTTILWPLNTVNSLVINGADNENDVLTVNFSASGFYGLPKGITFDGGSGIDSVSVMLPSTARGTFSQQIPSSRSGDFTFRVNGIVSDLKLRGAEQMALSDLQKFDFEGDTLVAGTSLSIATTTPMSSGDYLYLTSAQITGSGPLSIQSGSILQGEGTVNVPVAAELGSLILATGNLNLGRSHLADGFATRGQLNTGTHTVTLNDANQAVLGALTTLGSGSSPGTIDAANGLLIDFGNNVVGTGFLNTPDDPLTTLMVNGSITGNGAAEPITLPGFIKGVGRLDHVTITGTYSPGFSPAIAYVGNVAYAPGSTTVLEIAGTSAGTGYDRIVHAGTARPGGQLEIALLDGFVPSEGDQFTLMLADSIDGDFEEIVTPELPDGLTWKVTTSATAITAEVQLVAPTDRPVITGPGANSTAIRPEIAWQSVSGATEYEVWLGNQTTGVNPFHTATVSGTAYTPTVDLELGRFNLWVRARNSAGDGPWTQQYNVTVRPRASVDDPGRFQNTHQPTLTWGSIPGAVEYDLWINGRADGTSQFIREPDLTTTTWTPSVEMPLGLYHAWVRGIAADGTSSTWSPANVFYVMPSPQMTGGINPTFDRTPTFDWDPLTGAVEYEVFVRNRIDGSTTAWQRNIEDTQWTPATDLADGPYRVWVLGVSAANVRSFWTDPIDIWVGGRTDILTPAGTTTDSTPYFSWRAVDGAVRYDLWVDQVGGQSQIIRESYLTTASYIPGTSLPQGEFRVWVRAVSSASETSDWSVSAAFVVVDAGHHDGMIHESRERDDKGTTVLTGLLRNRIAAIAQSRSVRRTAADAAIVSCRTSKQTLPEDDPYERKELSPRNHPGGLTVAAEPVGSKN